MPGDGRVSTYRKIIFLCFAIVVIAVLVAVYFSPSRMATTCPKTSYNDFYEIRSFINSNADSLICSDFHKYVCGSWGNSRKDKISKEKESFSFLDEVKINNTNWLNNLLEGDITKYSRTTPASELKGWYNDCLKKQASSTESVHCTLDTLNKFQDTVIEINRLEGTNEKLKHANTIIEMIREAFVETLKNNQWLSNSTRNDILVKINATHVVRFLWENDNSIQNERNYSEELLKPFVNYKKNEKILEISYGALQKPLFDPSYENVVNIGRFGFLVAHELAFLAIETLYATDEEKEEFEEFKSRRDCLYQQYTETFQIPENFVAKTNDRDFADVVAVTVLLETLKKNEKNIKKTDESGWTLVQQLFANIALSQCAVEISDRGWKNNTEYYSRNQFRVRGEMTNNKDFLSAFNCKAELNRKTCNFN